MNAPLDLQKDLGARMADGRLLFDCPCQCGGKLNVDPAELGPVWSEGVGELSGLSLEKFLAVPGHFGGVVYAGRISLERASR